MSCLTNLFDEANDGEGIAEYGLITGLAAMLIISVFVAIGPEIRNMFTNNADERQIEKGQSSISAAIYN